MLQTLVDITFVILGVLLLIRCSLVVPQSTAFVLERFGSYSGTREAGLRFRVPIDVVRYKLSLKETAVPMDEQSCITRDNVQVRIDGVLYLKVFDPVSACYSIANYTEAVLYLAQIALRSEINKVGLDDLFESRSAIKTRIAQDLDKTSTPWGVHVTRYEIKNIVPPADVLDAVNKAEGEKQRVIKASEATRLEKINHAYGQAEAILAISNATAEGIRAIGAAVREPGGLEAMQLRVAEQWVKQGAVVLPDINSLVSSAMNMGTNPVATQSRPRED